MPWYWIALALVFGGFGLTGCGGEKDQIKEYPVSVPAAVRLLENADNASFRYFRQCGVLFDLSNYRSDDHTVTWTARAGGDEVLSFAVAIVHHANYKINKLKGKHLQNDGIVFPMPWLLTEFGNVSAASNMIAFLRELPNLKPFDHILIDGFGAGTYFDTLAVEVGG